MKKTRKIISGILTIMMMCTSNVCEAASVFVVPAQTYDPNSTYYKKIIDEYNEKHITLTDLSDLYSRALLTGGEAINVWENSQTNAVMYCEIVDTDSVSVSINTPYIDAEETEQLAVECLGEGNTIVVNNTEPNSSNIYVEFSSDDHEQNYDSCIKLKELFSEKYELKSCKAFINVHQFFEAHISWNTLKTNEPNFYNYNDEQTQNLNTDLAEHGIRAEYDCETQSIIFPDDITTRELLEYTAYIRETYGAEVSRNYLVKAQFRVPIDLLSEDKISQSAKSSGNGDANCDGNVNMSDAVAIMQFNADPDTYSLTEQGKLNADVIGGDGVTNNDALAIQQYEAGIISVLPIAE